MTYKKAQHFADYLDRSNRFVDRVVRGGNGIECTGAINAETDIELLLDARTRLLEIRAQAADVLLKAKAERADINRQCQGRPDHQLPPSLADRRRRTLRRYDDLYADLMQMNWRIDLLSGRLITLGQIVHEPDGSNPKVTVRKHRHGKVRPNPRWTGKNKYAGYRWR